MFINLQDIKPIKCNFIKPKKLLSNFFLIGVKINNRVVSFIYFFCDKNCLYINYSFTIKEYRCKGYSTVLRQFLINYATENSIEKIISTPFDGANSNSILKKLNFIQEGEQLILYI